MARRFRACLWFFLATQVALGAGASAGAPVTRIRRKMAESLGATPDFVCTVSLGLTVRTGSGAPLVTPPLSVEGGVISGKELYAWPSAGDDRARLKDILAIFSNTGTGAFALYSRALFLTVNATYYDAPDELKDNRRLLRSDFAMPREVSTYSLLKEGRPVRVGYSGSIWADPDNLDVVRLSLQAEGVPPDLPTLAVKQTFEYSRVKLADAAILLPVSMDLTSRERSGREIHLAGHFGDCRQYIPKRGNLLVTTAVEAPAPASLASPLAPVAENAADDPVLPEGLVLPMSLIESIDERTTTAGTRLSLTVSRDVKRKGAIVVPKGATASGHVTRIVRQVYPTDFDTLRRYYLVGMQLDTLTAAGKRYQIWANLESLGPPPPPPDDSLAFIPLSSDPNRWGTFDSIRTLFIVPPAEPGESFLGVVHEGLRLPDHLVMYWSSTPMPRAK